MGKRKHHDARSERSPRAVPVDLLIATGIKAQRTGEARAAEDAFRRALAASPGHPEAVQFLGVLLVERNELDEAIELFDDAAAALGDPTEATSGFFNNYANTLRRVGRYPSAEALLRQLVVIVPREWEPWHNLGQTLRDLERYDEAAAAMRRAVLLEPGFGPNHAVLGEILQRLGRLHSARVSLQRCIDLGWDTDSNLWTTIGNNQRLLGDIPGSIETLTHALALSGGTAAAHSNLGVVLQQAGRFDESVVEFDKAIALSPDDHKLHGYLGYTLLAAGQIELGWDEWEHAIQDGPRGMDRPVGVPRWTPVDTDARVLVYREQGVGDEIMFASVYPDLIAAASEVVIECDTRLVPLFTRSFPDAEVRVQSLDERGRQTTHDFDRAIPAGSVPRFFRRSRADFPDRRAYLVADAARVDAWRERLDALGPAPFVGVSWRSKVQTAERRLEYTRLEEWNEIFAHRDVTWVNLQYHEPERELRAAEEQFGVRVHRWDWLDLMNDFDEIAALVCALDLVVAPHNAVSMLSASLGVETVAMGMRYGWPMLGADDFPWMSHLRLAHRLPNEDWDDVLATAGAAVAETVHKTASRV